MNDPSVPAYEQVFDTKLFVLPRDQSDVGWAGLLIGRHDTVPDQPIALRDALLNYSSIFLFALSSPPANNAQEVEVWIESLRRYMDDQFGHGVPFNGRACRWLIDPDKPDFGFAEQTTFTFTQQGASLVTSSNFNNLLGQQITFSVGRNAFVAASDTYIRLNSIGTPLINFFTTPSNNGPEITPSETRIPITGIYSGCFLMNGRISSQTVLPFFDTGMRYGAIGDRERQIQQYPVFDLSAMPTSFNFTAALDPLDPTNVDTNTVDLSQGQLRTLFAPIPADSDGVLLNSYWLTDVNRSISLVAQGGGDLNTGPARFAGALVFMNEDPTQGRSGPLYLSLSGDWGLAVAGVPVSGNDAGAEFQLLPGLFGLETMSFRAYRTDGDYDRLRFLPNQNAYAPIFPFKASSLNNPSSGQLVSRLDDCLVTSYGLLVNGTDGHVMYLSQPEGSSLFAPSAQGVQDAMPLLPSYNPGTALSYQDISSLVPIVPYAGIDSAGEEFLNSYESQILSPTRKSTIAKQVAPGIQALKNARRKSIQTDISESAKLATTPQGLLAQITEANIGVDYQRVTLAQTEAAPKGASHMAFIDLEVPLQNLLQTNQLFAVIVNSEYLGDMLDGAMAPTSASQAYFQNTVTMSGWTMTAAVGDGVQATDYRNVMIFKFSDGTVVDRVTNPNKWIAADDFSLGVDSGLKDLALTGLSQWLQDYIAAAIIEWEQRKNPLYRNFATIVQDPNWNGILVLRSNVDPSGFPDELKGLTAGIDFSTFEAHHFGVSVSRVQVSGNSISINGLSSSFGLIDYQLPQFRSNMAAGGNPDTPLALPVEGPYNFTVLQLQAGFENAALQSFVSRVQLTTNELFDSKVALTYNVTGPLAANGVVLKGTYQSQGDQPNSNNASYVFKQESTTIFQLDSNLYNAITFNRVQFNTLNSNTGGVNPQIISRFLIWGAFDFVELPASQDSGSFDALSFGRANDLTLQQRGKGLAFSNLQVNLSSPVDTPNAVTYRFDPTGLGFDLAASETRPSSLFPTFALQIEDFIADQGSKRPIDYGYLPVRADVNLKAIDGPWFGVVYKVTMGTPGALVSAAGFESRLLLAWSAQTRANDSARSLFIGLQLPGAAPGAKLLSIQGVLKVSVGNIELLYEEVVGQSNKAFNLRLSNIGLKFLGIAKLPPGATINFFLFGDPAGNGSLGWYAAYMKDQQQRIAAL